MRPNIAGTGTVLPPGSAAARHALPDGPATVTIAAVDPENGYAENGTPVPGDHLHARCVYPCGFAKDHQVKGIDDLLPKVANQLKGRYGVAEVRFVGVPKALKVDGTINVEVTNGIGA